MDYNPLWLVEDLPDSELKKYFRIKNGKVHFPAKKPTEKIENTDSGITQLWLFVQN